MEKNTIIDLLNQLQQGVISELHISKEDFMNVRKVLVEREDFKHFRGIAQRGGGVIYKYSDTPRS